MDCTTEEIAKHDDASSCWIIIKNEVYDVTEFLSIHPGGPSIILKYAGGDATSAYDPIHPPDTIQKNLSPSQCLGPLITTTNTTDRKDRVPVERTQDEMRVEREMKRRPPLNRVLNLANIEDIAKRVLPYPVQAFYSAGTDDEFSLRENARAFDRFFFHARVMRPVSSCDPSTKILGYDSSLPVFVSGAAQAILGHPEGELNITRACGNASIIQMVCTFASIPRAQITAAMLPSQTLFFQLYKMTDTAATAKVVREAEELGYKAIFLTVDAVVVGNREKDVRSLWVMEEQEGKTQYYVEGDPEATTNLSGSSAVNRRNVFDPDLSWKETIPWLRSITKLPIVLKGSFLNDAVLAAEAGVEGILLSNHGVRNVFHSSLPPLEVLYRIRQQRPDVFDKLEGGIRRGTDVIKAICLGATAVGLGRPFLYALSAYGEAGVIKQLDILRREITISMRLLGAASIRDLTPEVVERVDWEPVRRRIGKL
ncbi:FMN-dependent dehydrogenase-domain-containing protein [Lentinula edodes]|uniref:FMN-dependent dehydrogenase-domain-containing protein n=1 Tax=Lentinula edodes TaxID=5353 RepID=UPI001E8EE47C|nr:FMN-dependent dehydrogenase-domain-containing protein [Lentinula edodes]KAH7868466.1 FMN-dependent dehydrogenase-domain-containing protein [Lentinula edodes]